MIMPVNKPAIFMAADVKTRQETQQVFKDK